MTRTDSRTRDKSARPNNTASRNLGSMVGMLMVLVITAGVVVYGIMRSKQMESNKPASVTENQAPEKVDPFAGMTYAYGDKQARPKTSGTNSDDPYASSAAAWSKARDLQQQAKALIDEITLLRADGDFAWREKNEQASELMEEAYELGVAWRERVIADKGAESREAKSLDRTLQDWNRTRIMLHKTGG